MAVTNQHIDRLSADWVMSAIPATVVHNNDIDQTIFVMWSDALKALSET